jgi:hypothetical protein
MKDEMKLYQFPCGETECYELANYELHIETVLHDSFVMPICYEHAMIVNTWVEKLTDIMHEAKKLNYFEDKE